MKHILHSLRSRLSRTPKSIIKPYQPSSHSKREYDIYKPRPQSYWYDDGSKWMHSNDTPPPIITSPNINTTTFRLISWNIDMLIGFAEPRMRAALTYLSTIVSSTPAEIPVIVFFQEMIQTDLKQIRDAEWIQEKFFITELDGKNWSSDYYGTTTLVDRRLRVQSVFRVPWVSKFQRDGLFVDVALSASSSEVSSEKANSKALRLCNTHLESLVADPPVRPLQLGAASPYLHDPKVASGVLAGDLNAIQPFDRTLHSDNILKDAYLALGGQEDSDEGFTWGYQVPQAVREKFGCSRMDKILFTGALDVKHFERIGMGVKVEEEVVVREMSEKGDGEWVTDHYGVMGDFVLDERWEFEVGGDGGESV
ncbi:hypothetical protein P280DRAFT_439553 [Massarina eburnea CBS 473.64]|uniref:Endonuclease/exonuclease/phosphatase domain-containing protein n=1 Tax=Massarina eburnea CBS 473.64 TaxID=1395130 RepID=A0A6A6RGA6_9PLEO|nr:hypothetical protein P280DRAFT_439553 [Massarina eburnea CBS 473.64]